MEITIDVPRTFEIDILKFRAYLLRMGWKHTDMYWDCLERFKSPKYAAEIAIPYHDANIIDKKYITIKALELLANHDNQDIETVIKSIMGEVEIHD